MSSHSDVMRFWHGQSLSEDPITQRQFDASSYPSAVASPSSNASMRFYSCHIPAISLRTAKPNLNYGIICML
jgi:hypothetical protein